ncbi:glycosyltransferase involved in cell wall biosynthesis [Luteimonas cucumeris]|uniref:Glycosyltransferase involved in cell wall biosynthesis n=1 Tax=Luteimonas cucumeris TaxID=985012 RepID=A0A562L285_9GAMM|nr:glycosyltransferase family 4 protein [Luteimonas cucumeris]TWI01738.1 glycosyltransferase involved in cell wall biosynthesis [Luteimonas cucumeris]
MRIAQIAPLYEAVPPSLYGGTERVVAHLTDALVDAGHEVTLFAAADADTRATLVPCRDQSIRLDPAPLKSDLAVHLAMLHEVSRRADQFDILHFHVDLLHYPFFAHCPQRTITTLHGRLDLKDLPVAYARWPQFPLASISDHQRRPLPDARWIGTVHHGLPDQLCPFSARAEGGYLAFLGRISPEKRVDRAIAMAKRAGLPLKIAAKVDVVDQAYYQESIVPLLDDASIEFVGEINDREKADFLGRATALLFPIDWPEPFGLVMIEAMACGTPVVAWECGSVPEVVDDGITGRIVRSLDEGVAAIGDVSAYDRRAIRDVFERRFTSAVMARTYLKLYWQLISQDETRRRSA